MRARRPKPVAPEVSGLGCFTKRGDWWAEGIPGQTHRAVQELVRLRRTTRMTPFEAVAHAHRLGVQDAFGPGCLDNWATFKGYDGSQGTWLWPMVQTDTSASACVKNAGYRHGSEAWETQRRSDAEDSPSISPKEAGEKISELLSKFGSGKIETAEELDRRKRAFMNPLASQEKP